MSETLNKLNIFPIKLIIGTNPNLCQTGEGCIMNVISYLNGDEVINDRPSNVFFSFRDAAIFLNDNLDYKNRQSLLKYIPRLMLTGAQSREWKLAAYLKYDMLMGDVEYCRVFSHGLQLIFQFLDENLPASDVPEPKEVMINIKPWEPSKQHDGSHGFDLIQGKDVDMDLYFKVEPTVASFDDAEFKY